MDEDEQWAVWDIQLAEWLGWDFETIERLTYEQVCRLIEYRRAQKEIEESESVRDGKMRSIMQRLRNRRN